MVKVWFNAFLALAVCGGKWLYSRSGCHTRGQGTALPSLRGGGGLEGAHNNSRHDVLTVSFMWPDVGYTFLCPQLVMLLGSGQGIWRRD